MAAHSMLSIAEEAVSRAAGQEPHARHHWKEPGIEPRLPDVLLDPLVQAVMRSEELRILIAKARLRLNRGTAHLADACDLKSAESDAAAADCGMIGNRARGHLEE